MRPALRRRDCKSDRQRALRASAFLRGQSKDAHACASLDDNYAKNVVGKIRPTRTGT
jgi:hypothetical protein